MPCLTISGPQALAAPSFSFTGRRARTFSLKRGVAALKNISSAPVVLKCNWNKMSQVLSNGCNFLG